jgi:hypothetical protein
MTTTPDRSPALQAAIDQLAAAENALGTVERLQMAQRTLAAGHDDKHPPQAREFWLALHVLINSGATPERVDRLVSTLEVGGGELRQMLVITARRAVTGDEPRAAMWQALQDLADSVVL